MIAKAFGIIALAVGLAASAGVGEAAAKGRACDGIAGVRCDSPKEFCEHAIGKCGVKDVEGVCTTIPEICPKDFNPVCGCDGNTYGNACEAAAKSQNIDHNGACKAK